MAPTKMERPRKAEAVGAEFNRMRSYSRVPVLYQIQRTPQRSIPSLTRFTKIAFCALFTAARR